MHEYVDINNYNIVDIVDFDFLPVDETYDIEVDDIHMFFCRESKDNIISISHNSACLSLFDKDDYDMLNCKGDFKVDILNGGFHYNPQSKLYQGEVLYKNKIQFITLSPKDFEIFQETKSLPWYYFEPQRARSNNSIVMLRDETTKDEFDSLWDIIKKNGSGEPGFFWTNDLECGTNPCAEVGFEFSRNFCNLTSINFSTIKDDDDFKERVWAATLLGTLQAGYTDFHYLSSKWQKNSETEALLGVSLTGICDNINYKNFDWISITDHIKETNKYYAEKIGINTASRICNVKPEGTLSLVMGTSSGIHARFAPYYIRRMRFNKNEPIAKYLINNLPELIEDEFGNPNGIVFSIPQKSPDGSIFRTETSIDTLERVKFFYENWILKTHNKGKITHNTSCTVNIKNNEWEKTGRWLWNNKGYYNAISVIPWDGGNYKQPPFEECTEEEYNRLLQLVHDIDLTKVIEDVDGTDLKGELACSGGSCDII